MARSISDVEREEKRARKKASRSAQPHPNETSQRSSSVLSVHKEDG